MFSNGLRQLQRDHDPHVDTCWSIVFPQTKPSCIIKIVENILLELLDSWAGLINCASARWASSSWGTPLSVQVHRGPALLVGHPWVCKCTVGQLFLRDTPECASAPWPWACSSCGGSLSVQVYGGPALLVGEPPECASARWTSSLCGGPPWVSYFEV